MSANNARIDREALHRYLWDRANHQHRIRVHQSRLAEALDVTRHTVNRVFKELTNAGRIRKVDSLSGNIGVYQVVDPQQFEEEAPEPHVRRIQWS